MQSFCLWEADCNQRSAQSAHLGLGDWGGESSSPTLLQKFHPSTATLTFWLFIPGSPKTLDSFILFWFFIPRSPKTLDPLPLLGFSSCVLPFSCVLVLLCFLPSLLPSFLPFFPLPQCRLDLLVLFLFSQSLVKLRSFSSSLQYEENAFLLTIEKVFGCSKNLQFEQPWRKMEQKKKKKRNSGDSSKVMEQKKKKKKRNSRDSSKVVSYMPLQNAVLQ